jgi:putative transposase
VVNALAAVSAERPLPKAITVDHGTEFTSKALDEWAYRRGVELDFIGRESPSRTRLSRVSTVDCVTNASTCTPSNPPPTQPLIEPWRRHCHDHRPHGALGFLTPSEYAARGQISGSEAAELRLALV